MVNHYQGCFTEENNNTNGNWNVDHELKILPEYFESVRYGEKRFELRKNDRDFKVGDWVGLREFSGGKYTGKIYIVQIRYILKNCSEYGLKNGYCIFGW